MAWTTVETEKAKYVLILEGHFRQARLPERRFDALVLEGFVSANQTPLPPSSKQALFGKAIQKAAKEKTPIFNGDLQANKKKFMQYTFMLLLSRFFAAALIPHNIGSVFLLGSWFLPAALIPGKVLKMRKPIATYVAGVDSIISPALIGPYRDALIAEKCEKLIVPIVQQKLSKKHSAGKPVIGIVYGAGHAGIASMLQRPAQRRRLLAKHSRKKGLELNPYMFAHFEHAKNGKWDTIPHSQEEKEFLIPPTKSLSRRISARARLTRMKTKKAWMLTQNAVKRFTRQKPH